MNPIDSYNFITQQYQAGADEKRKRTLADLARQAYSAPVAQRSALVSQAMGIDPDFGVRLGDTLSKQHEARQKATAQRVGLFGALPEGMRQQAYAEARPDVEAAFGVAPDGYTPEFGAAVAQTYGGMEALKDSTPAAIRELQMLQANPELAALDMKRRTAGFDRPQLQIDRDGNPWFLSPGKPPAPAFGGQGAPTQINYQTDDGQPVPADEQAALMQAIQASARGEDFTIAVPNGGDLSNIPPLSTFTGDGPRFGKPPEAPKQPARQMTQQEIAGAGLAPGTVAYMGENGVPNVVQRPASGTGDGGSPLPVGALREVLAIEDAIGASKHLASTLNKHAQRMVAGELQVSPMNAIGAKGRTLLGMANQSDSNLTEFKADITRTVNEWLRLNKGVQTEGDAQREFNAIMDSNDPVTVANAVKRLSGIIQNTVEIQQRKREQINRNYGRQQQPQGGGVRRVQSAADYDALPSGAIYIAPDGQQRRKR